MHRHLAHAWITARAAPLAWVAPLLLVLSVPQSPLFSNNQTTKFLHGAASAGYGLLAADWTATTLDPLPLFSALVRALFELRATWLVYPAFAALLVVYYVALLRIARRHFPALQAPRVMLVFLGLFLLLNKTGTAFSMESGLAGQYLLGSYFQPCVFGAFLLLGLERGLAGRFVTASAALALATAMHPTYVPAAVILFLTLAALARRQGSGTGALGLGSLIFLPVVAAVVLHHAWLFGPSDAATWQQSIAVLTRDRIPHHTQVARWFDPSDAARMLVMLAGIALVWRRPLGWVLGALFVPMTVSIGVLALAPVDWLSFATPWRLSVVVMPVSSTLLVAALASRVGRLAAVARAGALARHLPLVTIAGLVVWGVVQQVRLTKRHYATPEMDLAAYARAHAEAGQTYVVPPTEKRFNPFRLHSGVPIVVNWKTHPYKDAEVLEWHRRLTEVLALYQSSADDRCQLLDRLRHSYRVTHAVFPLAGQAGCEGWQPLYANTRYGVLGYAGGASAPGPRGTPESAP